MREVVDRNCLALRFFNTLDMDIWAVMATNSTIFNSHLDKWIFRLFSKRQKDIPALLRRSMKYWHARFGPGMPQEIIHQILRGSKSLDFMDICQKMYPSKLYVRSGLNYLDVECKTAFCFAAIRKKLLNAWQITAAGPSIDPEQSEGTANNPLDISDLQVSLPHFKLLNMLLSEKDHASVKNLTAD